MKIPLKLFLIAAAAILLINPVRLFPETQQTTPVLYLNFISHNEDADQFNNFAAYINKRNMIIQFANMLASKNMKHNFQSDWTFLKAVARYDTGSVVANTNGKNIIKWMVEDKGIECDPHSHESTLYNYADVAYLHEVLGIVPTKITGGFLYDTVINGNNWENLEAGLYGRYYTTYFWKPDILWGGGTPQHVDDPLIIGAYKPKSMAQFYVHDTTKNLTLIGTGCENKIFDTTNINNSIAVIRKMLNAIQNHSLPDTGFYTASIFTSNVTLTPNLINKLSAFIDTLAPYVAQGKLRFCKISETYNIWKNEYLKKPYFINCEDVSVGISHNENIIVNRFDVSQNYPNPFNPATVIKVSLQAISQLSVKVYDILGKEIAELASGKFQPGEYKFDFNASGYNLMSGVYFYKVENEKGESFTKKMMLLK